MSCTAAELQVIDLPRCLSRRGVVEPPPFVIQEGLAALAPETLRSKGWHIGQPLLIRRRNRVSSDDDLSETLQNLQITNGWRRTSIEEREVVAKAWPLRSVSVDEIALDELTLKALGLDYEHLARAPIEIRGETPRSAGKKKRRKRKSSGVSNTGQRISSTDGERPAVSLAAERESNKDCNDAAKVLKLRPAIVCVEALNEAYVVDAEIVSFVTEDEGVAAVVGSRAFGPQLHRVLHRRIVAPGTLVGLSVLGEDASLQVDQVQFAETRIVRYGLITHATNLSVRHHSNLLGGGKTVKSNNSVAPSLEDIGGLDREVQMIKSILRVAFDNEVRRYASKPRGLLLHGPTGTGKTMLAEMIAADSGVAVEFVRGPEIISTLLGKSEEAISAAFARASSKAPCIVVLDSVDTIALRRDSATASSAQQRLTATLLTLMDGVSLRNNKLFVIGTTNSVDSLDPAVRRPGRFDREIEIAVPNAEARYDILRRISSLARRQGVVAFSETDMKSIANNAYGFVGADLVALWRETVLQAIEREGDGVVHITAKDLRTAMSAVPPSALREVAVEIPSVRWDDIGGKEEIKERLKEAVEWPLSSEGGAMFKSIGIRPPRGILLFGPPGCSKTLLAKAVATESGANFISVKGPELLSKYVGESEKAVRSTFRRARSAAPCIIFFDEIDALATSRASPNASSAESRVLAQLLTELDGIDTLLSTESENHVVVIAATNRPDLLDPALLRPGRMDRLIYVGLPDEAETLSILSVCCRNTPIDNDVDLKEIAKWPRVQGMSGAELAAFIREAALAAMEQHGNKTECVSYRHFVLAVNKIRKSTGLKVLKFYKEYMETVKGVLLDKGDWKG